MWLLLASCTGGESSEDTLPTDKYVPQTDTMEVTADTTVTETAATGNPLDTTPTTASTGDTGDTGGPDAAPCGALVWARSLGGVYGDQSEDLVALPDGGFAVAGLFSDTLVLGAGEINETTLVSLSTFGNTFLATFDIDGTLRWAKAGVGFDDVNPTDVQAGLDGSLLLGGERGGDATFDDFVLPHVAYSDGWIVRYDPSGSSVFATAMDGDSLDQVNAVTMGPSGTMYAAGEFFGELALPDGTVLTNPEDIQNDGWLAKWEADGSFAWAKHLSGTNVQLATGVAATDDEVAVIGRWTEAVIVPGGSGFYGLGIGELFLAQFASDGTWMWDRTDGGYLGGEFPGELHALGGAWVVGGLSGRGEFGLGELNETIFDGVISLYTASWDVTTGSLVSALELLPTLGGGVIWNSGAWAADGQIALAGVVAGTTLGEGTPNEVVIAPTVPNDPLIATFDGSGAFLCTWTFEGGGAGLVDSADGIAFDGQGGIWVAGTYMDTLTLSPGTPEEVSLSSTGGTEIFLARYLLLPPADTGLP